VYSQWKDGEFQSLSAKAEIIYPYSVAGTASFANVTLHMRYRNYKKVSNSLSPELFFLKLKMHQNPISALLLSPLGGRAYDASQTSL